MEAFFQFCQTYWANWVAQSVTLDLRSELYNHVLKFRLKYFDKTPVGQLVTRHVGDIDGIADVFSNGLLNAVGDILKLAVIIGAMLWVDVPLTAVILLPIPVLLLATRVFQKAIKKAFVSVRNEVARINVFVQEHVTGMGIIQAFGREEAERQKFACTMPRTGRPTSAPSGPFPSSFPLLRCSLRPVWRCCCGLGLMAWRKAK